METIESQFVEAIKSNNLANISDCIDKGVNINIENNYAVKYVSYYGHLETYLTA